MALNIKPLMPLGHPPVTRFRGNSKSPSSTTVSSDVVDSGDKPVNRPKPKKKKPRQK